MSLCFSSQPLAPAAENEGAEVLDGDELGEQPDSDEERETTRAARVRAANTEAAKAPAQDEDMPSVQAHLHQVFPLVAVCLLGRCS